jgi:hypothetical protein
VVFSLALIAPRETTLSSQKNENTINTKESKNPKKLSPKFNSAKKAIEWL